MGILKNLFKSREVGITAERASIISKFGVDQDIETILKTRIHEIECQIVSKLEFNSKEKLLALLVLPGQEELYELIRKEFASRGYITFYVDKTRVADLKENNYLFISWDI